MDDESEQQGLLEVGGISPAQVAGVYQAAAAFYRQAPWKRLAFEAAIEVTSTQLHGGPWHAFVMGQAGLTYGLALYDDLEILKRMWDDNLSDEENAERSEATTIQFVEPDYVPFADLEAARQHGWEIARPEAHPWLFHKERGMKIRALRPNELLLVEACLRAIPGFMQKHPQDDLTKETLRVRAAERQIELTLSWVSA